jgi:hypothetical protein
VGMTDGVGRNPERFQGGMGFGCAGAVWDYAESAPT